MSPTIKFLLFFAILPAFNLSPARADDPNSIIVENTDLRLVIQQDGTACSLIHKSTGQECLAKGTKTSAFSLTQYRPYPNELQLKYPANPMTFAADAVSRTGNQLKVSFEHINIRAVINLKITDHYIGFSLEKLEHVSQAFGDPLKTITDELVLLQLPVKDRTWFGEWLNVSWDNEVAVNLLGTDPYTKIDAVKNEGYHILRATAVSEVKGVGVGAALITTAKNNLLDCVDRVERDYNLPLGVESRRKKEYRYSYYEPWDINPGNVDEHISYARKAGMRSIQIVWTAFAATIGHFPWRPEYPNGMKDLQLVVNKIKEAGMTVGAHLWFNKTMKKDLYVTPVPDYRLNLSRPFTLAAYLDKSSTEVVVEENPEGSMMDNERRILKIGNELISYTGFTTERPYRFTGCKRGDLNTTPSEYQPGCRFGILDVDTWPIWVRFDQRTGIQDEVAGRIAKIYNEAGFQYVYFDGSEDIHPPFWFNASMAQLKVHSRLNPAPLFSEGALKSHFSWHILTRGNAFDVFAPGIVKDATRKHPLDEAGFIAQDFTSIEFGWMDYLAPGAKTMGMQPDMYEFICSKAAAWDCPFSLEGKLDQLKKHPRTADNLEAIRRWEEARLSNFFTEEQKLAMRDPDQEYTLLVNESGKYELQPCEQLTGIAAGSANVRAFLLKRAGKTYLMFWHPSGEAKLSVKLDARKVRLFERPGTEIPLTKSGDGVILPLKNRHYLELNVSKEEAVSALRNAKIL